MQPTVEILQVPVLGAGLDMPVVVHDRCVTLRPCDHAATSSSRVTVRYIGKTVEIPQVQFLDQVFADCAYWHIDKVVDVPVISSPLMFDHLY